ncbi:hypothetical protein F4820DRAFT_402543 [Hypoxylon rubiginosum]|uniref:Uncharacterized protein n=1 Tax=Hypoxylon rubiginosum TaxID=110542 RepID=A0ACB9ZG92_9PEZI|nr:hypothetical protein F4820DRAFT_402543 [Hypoxylon rubiginosum]
MASSADDLRSIMESTLVEFFDSYPRSVRNKDPSLLSATLTEECARSLKPDSFLAKHPYVKAVETNAEYEAHMAPEISIMEEVRFKILDRVVDPLKRKASSRVEHWTKLAGRKQPTILEICWFVDFTEDGRRISRIVEFIDTSVASKIIEELAEGGYNMEEAAAAKT